MWQNFQKALEQRVISSGAGKVKNKKQRVDKYMIEAACRRVIAGQFGKIGESQVFFEKFKNQKLELRCKKSTWKSEIRIRKGDLIKDINEELKNDSVVDIIVK